MRTSFRIEAPYGEEFLEIARGMPCHSPSRPTRFMHKMERNQGSIGMITGFGLDKDGLERKNPLIVALGDSVTAGHFENLVPLDDPKAMELSGQRPRAVEITDSREGYLEQFRNMLIDKYELTSVSAINAGIAGDHLISMAARAQRDVIRYQPDLVLINGVLNWSPALGSTQEYKACLTKLVERIQGETEADIILLTCNGDLPHPLFGQPPEGQRTCDRVRAVREVAAQRQVCLADCYAVWEKARERGIPWEKLLANGVNHPSLEGHTVYAIVLMKLFAGQ